MRKLFKNKKEMFKNIMFTLLGVVFAVVFLSKYDLQQVDGVSMDPTFEDNDFIIVDLNAKPQDLDVVIIDVTDNDIFTGEHLIKRYYEEYSVNGMYVIGDNTNHSLDSRMVGEFDNDSCDGVVVFNVSKFFKDIFNSFTSIFNP